MFRAQKLTRWHLPFGIQRDVSATVGPAVAEAFDCCAYVVSRRILHRPSPRQLFCLACLVVLSVLAVGAVGVTEQLVGSPRRVRSAESAVAQWGRDVVVRVAPSERQAWEDLVISDPVLVLKVCAVSIVSGGRSE